MKTKMTREERMTLRQNLIDNNAMCLPRGTYNKKVVINGKPVMKKTACFFLKGEKQLVDFIGRLA